VNVERIAAAARSLAKFAARLDLPVPAVPVTSTLLPRKNPFPSIISSRAAIPVDTLSLRAL